MNSKEYGSNVLITESCDFPTIKGRLDDKMIRLLHASTGFSSELAELSDAYADPKDGNIDWVNIGEEAGDLSWYCAVAVNALGFDPEEISSYESQVVADSLIKDLREKSPILLKGALLAAVCAVGEYNDLVKKSLFYGKEIDMKKMKQTLQQLCMSISGLCFVSGTTTSEVRQKNIDKLKARYGEKFSEAAALNRNLDAERKILEGNQS